MVRKREKSNYLIQSVSHAIDVLDELKNSGKEVGVTELANRLDLHKNNVFRLLATLELRGYVEQNLQTENYRLGVKCLELGQSYRLQSPLIEVARPVLEALRDATGETVSLAILQNGIVQYPLSYESNKHVKVAPRVAVSFDAKACAVGRLLLAHLPDEKLEQMLSTNTPQEAAVRNQLVEIRTTGKIIDRGGIEPEVVCISQIFKGAGGFVGAIEVLSPQFRAKIDGISDSLEKSIKLLSKNLGASATNLSSKIVKEVVNSPKVVPGDSLKATVSTTTFEK